MWDGTKWVPDVSPIPPSRPTSSRWANLVANVTALLVGLALVIPFSAGFASTSVGPTLSLTPANGPAGSTVVVTGVNFEVRTKVQLTWDGKAAGLPMVSVNRRGIFRVSVTIPTTTTAGDHTLGAV